MDITYRVSILGVASGQRRADVATRLGQLFKMPADRVAPLLSKPEATIKRGVDFQRAAKIKAALERSGCVAVVAPELEAIEPETPAPPPAPAIHAKRSLVARALQALRVRAPA